jgi:flagellar hook-basal body complex protein FliE
MPVIPPSVSSAAAGNIAPAANGAKSGDGFGSVMNDLIGQVNQSQAKADHMVESLALGEPVEVHQVMIALNEASNALNLTLQVRNKALEAYQDVMRLQI